MAATDKVLREIGAGEIPRVLALNKMDLVTDPAFLDGWKDRFPGGVPVSAKTGSGVRELSAAVEDKLTAASGEARLRVPDAEYAMVALLHREASILEEGREDDATLLRARLPARLESRFEKYRIGG
jgi:GTP-binding protein HflX